MRDMYLTRKAQARAAAAGLVGAFNRSGSESMQRDAPLLPFDPMVRHGHSPSPQLALLYLPSLRTCHSRRRRRPDIAAAAAAPLSARVRQDDDADIQQLEDLLETYFTQVDNSFNKLQVLEQYVNDTEDFINIDLDSHRNQLIEIDLMLSFAMFISSLYTLVTGVFGMNLDSGLQEDPYVFREVTIICAGLVVVGFALFVWLCRRKRLIQLSF